MDFIIFKDEVIRKSEIMQVFKPNESETIIIFRNRQKTTVKETYENVIKKLGIEVK